MSGVLQDQVAIVTGGAQGLGRAICHRLAREGARVAVADLNLDGAKRVAREIGSPSSSSPPEGGRDGSSPTQGGRDRSGRSDRGAIAIEVDVTDEAQVAAMVDRTVEIFGQLDILISNAGILIAQPIADFPASDWRAVIEVNLVGYFLCAKHAVRVMKGQYDGSGEGGVGGQNGVIIQINSKSGKKGSYKNSAYAASKFGGIGLTQSLALELTEHGVRVNAICPGNLLDSPLWVDSLYEQYAEKWGITEEEVRQKYVDQVPMKRGCTYDDVTNVVVFLASDQASYITGQAVNVTGGQEMN
jgi:sorbitol-6-phosphate 2-dehydrogenase